MPAGDPFARQIYVHFASSTHDLEQMGHEVSTPGRQGDAHTIWIAPDRTPHGVNNGRRIRRRRCPAISRGVGTQLPETGSPWL